MTFDALRAGRPEVLKELMDRYALEIQGVALALIEEDHGFAIAKGVAQRLVVYHRRHGGQSQFAASVDLAPKNDRIAAALGYARDHIAEVLTVERLGESAGMSLRQFSRAFRTQTGTTPARVVEQLLPI